MIGSLQSLALLIPGYILIFSGVAFSNKLLLPSLLEGVYEKSSFIVRIIIFTIAFAGPANYLIAKSFQVTSPSIAGILLIGTVLVISIVNAMILDRVQPTLPIVAAAAAALFFCALTAWLLEGQKAIG